MGCLTPSTSIVANHAAVNKFIKTRSPDARCVQKRKSNPFCTSYGNENLKMCARKGASIPCEMFVWAVKHISNMCVKEGKTAGWYYFRNEGVRVMVS